MIRLAFIFVSLMIFSGAVFPQSVGINNNGSQPDSSAILDVQSTDKGLLIPRVALIATNAAGPITDPATSLLVYNTATAGESPNNVIPGFYYWNGSAWVLLSVVSDGTGTTNYVTKRDVQTREKGQWAMVTFSFDDGKESDYTVMKPLFAAKGVPAATNIICNLVGTAGFMTWAQIAELEADGWEICSHTQTHRRLTELHSDSIHWQLKTSLDTLKSRGLNVNNLAYPNNSFNDTVQYIARQYYRSARAAPAYTWPDHYKFWNDEILNTYHLSCVNAETQDSLAYFKRLVDSAEMFNRWLIFYTHAMTTADSVAWADLIDYIQAKDIPIVTQNQALDLIGNQIDTHPGFAVHNNKMRLDGAIYKGNHLFLHNYDDGMAYGYNTFLGLRSGNETMTMGEGSRDLSSYNSGFGYETLKSLTTGYGNTAIGYLNQTTNLSGAANTSVGYFALSKITTGVSNTIVGGYAGSNITTASNNTYLGKEAGLYQTGSLNTFLGTGAGVGVNGSSTGTSNTGVGVSSLLGLTTGTGNVAVGRRAGEDIAGGNYNTVVGYLAGSNTTAGGSITAIGYNAGLNSTGSNNTFIGVSAGNGGAEATSSYSTAIGLSALHSHTGALRSLAAGAYAGYSTTSGDDNTFVGYSAGYTNATGTGNVMLGYNAGYNTVISNRLIIDNANRGSAGADSTASLIYGNFSTKYVRINDILQLNPTDTAAAMPGTIYIDSDTDDLMYYKNGTGWQKLNP